MIQSDFAKHELCWIKKKKKYELKEYIPKFLSMNLKNCCWNYFLAVKRNITIEKWINQFYPDSWVSSSSVGISITVVWICILIALVAMLVGIVIILIIKLLEIIFLVFGIVKITPDCVYDEP